MVRWSGIWNPSVCAVSIAATSATVRMRLSSTITARSTRSLRIRRTPAPLLHKLIPHFQSIALTWLLLPADFVSTLQAVPFLSHCSDIVTIGRVKWIEGSKYTSKDNLGWYRFDARHKGRPLSSTGADIALSDVSYYGAPGSASNAASPMSQQRSSSRFCSQACRQRAHRKRLSVTSSVTPTPAHIGSARNYSAMFDTPTCRKFTAEGWEALPALDGTHHGEYSVLMRRIERG